MITEVVLIADDRTSPLYIISTLDDGYLIVDEFQLNILLKSTVDIITFNDINLTIDRSRFIAVMGA